MHLVQGCVWVHIGLRLCDSFLSLLLLPRLCMSFLNLLPAHGRSKGSEHSHIPFVLGLSKQFVVTLVMGLVTLVYVGYDEILMTWSQYSFGE